MRSDSGIRTIVIFSLMLLSTTFSFPIFSKIVSEETMTIPMYVIESEEKAYTTEIFRVPFFIKNVRVDVSVKANSNLEIVVELAVGPQRLEFCINNMSVGYHLEQDRIQLDGKISEQAVSVKATIKTNGEIEDCPNLILTFYSIL